MMRDTNDLCFLCAKNLTFVVDGKTILEDISFQVFTGERVAIFGPSGAGKSTLIRLLNRLDEPTSGTVLIEGQDYRQISPAILRRRLGLVMQQPYLFPGTVEDNLRFGPAAHGETLDEDIIRELLHGVDLAGFAERDVSNNLARTLANKPEILMLDEPTSSLDGVVKREVEDTILSVIQAQVMTCILVTHDQQQVQRLADRVLLLKGGALVGDGPIREVLDAQSVD